MYVQLQRNSIAVFGGLQATLQKVKAVMCCLDGENLVGSRKDPVFVAKLPSQHFRCAALFLSGFCRIPIVHVGLGMRQYCSTVTIKCGSTACS